MDGDSWFYDNTCSSRFAPLRVLAPREASYVSLTGRKPTPSTDEPTRVEVSSPQALLMSSMKVPVCPTVPNPRLRIFLAAFSSLSITPISQRRGSPYLQVWGQAVGEFIRRPHSSISSLALMSRLWASALILPQHVGVKRTVLFVFTSSWSIGIFFSLFCPFFVVIFSCAVYTRMSIANKQEVIQFGSKNIKFCNRNTVGN